MKLRANSLSILQLGTVGSMISSLVNHLLDQIFATVNNRPVEARPTRLNDSFLVLFPVSSVSIHLSTDRPMLEN
ncbi:hypothetical protein ASPCADRAFT_209604 [Aspergillus carbonarius ITEM 5010]|uniref:Uncharacterized protein n=1 Tax=Aspergillus carbonarius (strain ITEM 5010) TaxID=602072 RepID=A0A1R3REN1_ASPC5|nr:hypothetical protein ASPCADRAFT_209604 [Aspergillus carbonarius ITEM 5010]